MTPQERELVTELFDRLATLETQPRDPDAERAILDGLRRAPNATYALVQTTLVQDEALRRADAHIQELEAQLGDPPANRPAGFLDGMRDALLGPREPARGGSVPSVRPAQAQTQDRDAAPPWRAAPAAPGGSFLGTAAAAAAGVVGGSLLLDSFRSMMGHGHGASALADPTFGAGRDPGSPWDNSGGGELARQAGVDDIGRSQHAGGGGSSGLGLLDSGDVNDEPDADQDVAFDDSDSGGFDGGDFGGDDSGSSEA